MKSINNPTETNLYIPVVSAIPLKVGISWDETSKKTNSPDLSFKSIEKHKDMTNNVAFNFSTSRIAKMVINSRDAKTILLSAKKQESEAVEALFNLNNKQEITTEKNEKYVIRRSNLLEQVTCLLERIFTDQPVETIDFKLPAHELNLLKSVVIKKYSDHINTDTAQSTIMSNCENVHYLISHLKQAYQTKKRKEEKIKFVFKHVLKKLRENYFEKHSIPIAARKDVTFVNFYFGEHNNSDNITLDQFYDPLNTSYSINPRYKTLSKSYLLLLFKYPKFKEDFLSYMHGDLMKDYQAKTYKKFKKLFKRLRKRIRTSGPMKAPGVIQDFVDKLTINKRCKLPWTPLEIKDAVQCFSEHLSTLITKG